MTDEAKGILRQILALSESDRLELTELLSDLMTPPPSNPFEFDPEFKEELMQRVEEIRSGKVEGIPAEEVFRRSREKYP